MHIAICIYPSYKHNKGDIILTLAIYLWINGLNVTDVAVATIITFTMPIFVLILAATLLLSASCFDSSRWPYCICIHI
jgi:hypothetical protein